MPPHTRGREEGHANASGFAGFKEDARFKKRKEEAGSPASRAGLFNGDTLHLLKVQSAISSTEIAAKLAAQSGGIPMVPGGSEEKKKKRKKKKKETRASELSLPAGPIFVPLTSRKLVFDMSRDSVGIPPLLFLVRATAARKTRLERPRVPSRPFSFSSTCPPIFLLTRAHPLCDASHASGGSESRVASRESGHLNVKQRPNDISHSHSTVVARPARREIALSRLEAMEPGS